MLWDWFPAPWVIPLCITASITSHPGPRYRYKMGPENDVSTTVSTNQESETKSSSTTLDVSWLRFFGFCWATRWAPTSEMELWDPCKWPYKWATAHTPHTHTHTKAVTKNSARLESFLSLRYQARGCFLSAWFAVHSPIFTSRTALIGEK